MVLGYIIIRSPYTPYSIYLTGTIGSGSQIQGSRFALACPSMQELSFGQAVGWSLSKRKRGMGLLFGRPVNHCVNFYGYGPDMILFKD